MIRPHKAAVATGWLHGGREWNRALKQPRVCVHVQLEDAAVVGDAVVGDAVVGEPVVGDAVVGAAVVGKPVVRLCVRL